MRWSVIFGLCTGCFLASLIPTTQGQIGARNTIPETVLSCYMNSTAYNRYTRQPMHINNLIAIIRKIERKEPQKDMRRLARILVNRYMFDGLQFDYSAKPDFQFTPKSEEAIKTNYIKQLIPLQGNEIFTPGVLDNDEMCALHWMLSHSMNATIRDEELYPYGSNPYGSNPYDSNPYGSGSGNNPGFGYNSNPGNGYNINGGGYNSNYPSSNNKIGRRRRDADEPSHEVDEEEKDQDMTQEIIKEPASNPAAELKVSEEEQDNPHHSLESEEDSRLGRALPGLQSDDDPSKSSKQVIDPARSKRPLETGVVYTPWGSISAGRLIAGIAAGLQPMTIPVTGGSPYPSGGWPSQSGTGSYSPGSGGPHGFSGNGGSNPFGTASNDYNSNPFNPSNSNPNPNPNPYGSQPYGRRRKRQIYPINLNLQPLQNIHAATLAGDVGQAAIRNGRYNAQSFVAPKGTFNDTVCPREYLLEPPPYGEFYRDEGAYTYMTQAEIRGGMDGIILGQQIVRWDNAGFRLSEILEMYYSEAGIAGESQYRSCDRSSLYSGSADANVIREQSRSFAYLYNNVSQVIPPQQIAENPNAFLGAVDETFQRMQGVASTIGSDGICKRRPTTSTATLDTDDSLKLVEIKNRVYAVLDHTVPWDEIVAQKRFIGQLAHEINVSPRGSRLGIVDGSSGQILISPNWTDTSSILACNVLSLPTQTKTQDVVRVLNNMKSEVQKLKDDEIRWKYESDLGIVLLFLVQGRKLEEGQRHEIRGLLEEFRNRYGDVRVLFASSRYQQTDFEGFLLDPQNDFMRIQSVQNLSDFADEFANDMRQRTHGRLAYTTCNVNHYNQDEEHKVATTFFVSPDTIQYYIVPPDYFYSAKNLRLRFSTDNGKVRICQHRDERFPTSRNVGGCQETKGSYVSPGSGQVDVEFHYEKPCGKHGNRDGCKPIYLSFTPTQYPSPGQAGLDCEIEGCQAANQVKVTFTHWDMRCNGSMKNVLSLPVALISVLLSMFIWRKST